MKTKHHYAIFRELAFGNSLNSIPLPEDFLQPKKDKKS